MLCNIRGCQDVYACKKLTPAVPMGLLHALSGLAPQPFAAAVVFRYTVLRFLSYALDYLCGKLHAVAVPREPASFRIQAVRPHSTYTPGTPVLPALAIPGGSLLASCSHLPPLVLHQCQSQLKCDRNSAAKFQ